MAEEAAVVNTPVDPPTAEASAAPEIKEELDDLATADKQVADSLAKQETEDGETEVKTEKPVEETKAEPPAKGYEQRKEQLSGDITTLVAQRNALRTEVEILNGEAYRPATEDELKEQGYSPEMAAIENFKQEQAIRDYNNQVADKQLELKSEALSIVRDFPELSPVLANNEPNPDYNQELGSQLDAILGLNLQTDPNTGQIIGSTIPPYQIYKLVADATRTSEQAGQLKGQQAAEEMLSRADPSSGATPPKETNDLFLKGLLGEK